MVRCIATVLLMGALIGGIPGPSSAVYLADDPILRAEGSTSTKELVELWEGIDAASFDVPLLSQRALENKLERVRIFGAMLLSKVEAENKRRNLLAQAIRDSSVEVRRVGWLNSLGHETSTPLQNLQELLEERDLILQAVGVLALSDDNKLSELAVTTDSAFVQAVAVRRLARVWPKKSEGLVAAQSAIDHALTSGSPLPRSSALLSAMTVEYFPVPTLRGITFDDRPLVQIDELLDITDHARRLRAEFGLPGEFQWSMSLLKQEFFRRGLLLGPRELPRTLMPLDDPLRMGTIAGEGMLRANFVEGSAFIHRISRLSLDKRLVRQLKLLMSRD